MICGSASSYCKRVDSSTVGSTHSRKSNTVLLLVCSSLLSFQYCFVLFFVLLPLSAIDIHYQWLWSWWVIQFLFTLTLSILSFHSLSVFPKSKELVFRWFSFRLFCLHHPFILFLFLSLLSSLSLSPSPSPSLWSSLLLLSFLFLSHRPCCAESSDHLEVESRSWRHTSTHSQTQEGQRRSGVNKNRNQCARIVRAKIYWMAGMIWKAGFVLSFWPSSWFWGLSSAPPSIFFHISSLLTSSNIKVSCSLSLCVSVSCATLKSRWAWVSQGEGNRLRRGKYLFASQWMKQRAAAEQAQWVQRAKAVRVLRHGKEESPWVYCLISVLRS